MCASLTIGECNCKTQYVKIESKLSRTIWYDQKRLHVYFLRICVFVAAFILKLCIRDILLTDFLTFWLFKIVCISLQTAAYYQTCSRTNITQNKRHQSYEKLHISGPISGCGCLQHMFGRNVACEKFLPLVTWGRKNWSKSVLTLSSPIIMNPCGRNTVNNSSVNCLCL